MCIIIKLPSAREIKSEITKEVLEFSWESNQHGGGYAYVDKVGTSLAAVKVIKNFTKFKSFYKSFSKKRGEHPDSKFLIHFRYATRGKISNENCHPFYIQGQRDVFAHNGTVQHLNAKGDISDTVMLRDLFKKIPYGFYMNAGMNALVYKYIGGNRIVILNKNNRFYTYNDDAGEYVDDIWFSNDYYKTKRKIEKVDNVYNGAWYKPYKKCACGKNLYTPKAEETGKCYECTHHICSICGIELNSALEKQEKKCFDCLDVEKRYAPYTGEFGERYA